jgi:hypothetical protein
MDIPDYIEQRIRRPPPIGCGVVPGSSPVVSFGNSLTATAATLGLNPSRREFLDERGNELGGDSRRLATHTSLGVLDLSLAPSEAVAAVLADCNNYFHGNPYRGWFDHFTPILEKCGASFYDGTACHLDLVQWATDPTWARLQPASARRRLLEEDSDFLAEQLRREHLRLLLVNGRGVIRHLRPMLDEFRWNEPIVGLATGDTQVGIGRIAHVRVLAWSTNLQSSRGVKRQLRGELALRVKRWLLNGE